LKVQNLKSLVKKIAKQLDKSRIESTFHEFTQALSRVLLSNQRQTPVSDLKTSLVTAFEAFDEIDFTYSERRLFDQLGYDNLVGSGAVKRLNKILYDANFDPAGVNAAIEKYRNEFVAFAADVRSLSKSLEPIPSLEEVDLGDDEQILEISFLDGTAIDNIVDFQKWIDNWAMILRNFSMLFGLRPESARIVFVQKSSPLLMDIATVTAIAIAIGKGTDFVLARIEKYMAIRKQYEEVKKLKLENKKIANELDKEAEKYARKSAEEIAKQIIADSNKTVDGEIESGLTIGINNLFIFIDRGGRVDCTTAHEEGNEPELHEVYKSIREVQKSVDQLRLTGPTDSID
jgi:hypothetical protein